MHKQLKMIISVFKWSNTETYFQWKTNNYVIYRKAISVMTLSDTESHFRYRIPHQGHILERTAGIAYETNYYGRLSYASTAAFERQGRLKAQQWAEIETAGPKRTLPFNRTPPEPNPSSKGSFPSLEKLHKLDRGSWVQPFNWSNGSQIYWNNAAPKFAQTGGGCGEETDPVRLKVGSDTIRQHRSPGIRSPRNADALLRRRNANCSQLTATNAIHQAHGSFRQVSGVIVRRHGDYCFWRTVTLWAQAMMLAW